MIDTALTSFHNNSLTILNILISKKTLQIVLTSDGDLTVENSNRDVVKDLL